MAKQLEIDFDGFASDEPEQNKPEKEDTSVKIVIIDPEDRLHENEEVTPNVEAIAPVKDAPEVSPEEEPKKIPEIPQARTKKSLPADDILFSKAYYPIGEVAKMLGEEVSLVRYWSNEFKVLKPRKNRKGDRYFRPEDVKNIYLIYDLLRVRKFTIEGAKKFIADEKLVGEKFEVIAQLKKLKGFLEQLKNNL